MTIHHDKMAYGRFASLREDFSEERLEEMAKKLSEGAAEEDGEAEKEADSSSVIRQSEKIVR